MINATQKFYELNYDIFVILGLGRIQNENKRTVLSYSAYCQFIRLVYFFVWFFEAWDAYLVRNNHEQLIINLCASVVVAATFLKLYTVNYRYDLLLKVRENFKFNFTLPHIGKSDEDIKIAEKYSSHFSKIGKIIYGFTAATISMYCIFPGLVYYITGEKIYPLPLPEFFGKASPIYEIIYVAHSFILIHFLFFAASIDVLFVEMLVRTCENFEVLIKNLAHVKQLYDRGRKTKTFKLLFSENARRSKETFKLMRENIVHHQKILRQLNDINEIYSLLLFLQVTLGSLLASCTIFNMILVS